MVSPFTTELDSRGKNTNMELTACLHNSWYLQYAHNPKAATHVTENLQCWTL